MLDLVCSWEGPYCNWVQRIMHIHLEANNNHTIQGYTDRSVTLLSQTYHNNILVGPHFLIDDWQLCNQTHLELADFERCLPYQPRIILLGAAAWHQLLSPKLKAALEEKHIAVEAMNIGAACRTFNVLVSEHREVALGIILNT